jgi:rhodanese-related sulfurtransferase
MKYTALLCIAGLLSSSAAVADQAAVSPAANPPPAAPAAAATAAAPLISQDALTERQARHDPSLFLLDVRTPEEFAAGHVPGAVNIPQNQIASHLTEIPKDKDVVLYCHSGRRAGLAAEELAAAGYKRLYHLQGDMAAWVKDGRPVEAAADKKPAG